MKKQQQEVKETDLERCDIEDRVNRQNKSNKPDCFDKRSNWMSKDPKVQNKGI